MKAVFTGEFEALKSQLEPLGGEWDESAPQKKILRRGGALLNWFETTGTLQFQGKAVAAAELERDVKSILYPGEYSGEMDAEDPKHNETNSATPTQTSDYFGERFSESEIIFGIVSAVGTESRRVIEPLANRLKTYGYSVTAIKVSELLDGDKEPEYVRIKALMAAGDSLRAKSNNNAILAEGVAWRVGQARGGQHRRAYVVDSLKRPEEVELLRKIYAQGFFTIGIHSDLRRRLNYLIDDKGLKPRQAEELTKIDEDENVPHGQRTRDTYHLADFFVNLGQNEDHVKNMIERFLELIFSHPYKNPTFDEFAMFMAFCSSIPSSELSRQVGAVLTRNNSIVSTGTNECPKSQGGQYWAVCDSRTGVIDDEPQGKEYTQERDSNRFEKGEIISGIVEALVRDGVVKSGDELQIRDVLEASRIRDLTEFGRVVHAEMNALLACSRVGISTQGTTMYSTTFPCHNCAKHIVAAGVVRVVYVEPYPKSKALELHADAIHLHTNVEEETNTEKVVFQPFTGVGVRRFLDLFSMTLGAGRKLVRKHDDGRTVDWHKNKAELRVPLFPKSYLELELEAAKSFEKSVNRSPKV